MGADVKLATIQMLLFANFYFWFFFSTYRAKYIFNTVCGQNFLEIVDYSKSQLAKVTSKMKTHC